MKGKRVELFTFSGTGNGEAAARILAKELTSRRVPVAPHPWSDITSFRPAGDSVVGFILPMNSQFTMPFLWKNLRGLSKGNGQPYFLLITMNESGVLSRPIMKLLAKKGWKCLAAVELSFPRNISVGPFDLFDDHRRTAAARENIGLLAKSLVSDKILIKTTGKGSAIVSFLSRETPFPWIVQRFLSPLIVDDGICLRCGLCAEIHIRSSVVDVSPA